MSGEGGLHGDLGVILDTPGVPAFKAAEGVSLCEGCSLNQRGSDDLLSQVQNMCAERAPGTPQPSSALPGNGNLAVALGTAF